MKIQDTPEFNRLDRWTKLELVTELICERKRSEDWTMRLTALKNLVKADYYNGEVSVCRMK